MRLNYEGGYYEGDVKDGKPHGRGKRVWDDGDVYEGEWKDGKKHGAGKYTYASGSVYEGDWLNGKRHGKGKYTWSDGGVYEGYFVEDKIRGKGKITYANGEVYEGNFAENMPRGKGVKTYIDGTEISGNWTDRNNAERAVRKRGKTVEYGSLKNGEFTVEDVIFEELEEAVTPEEIDAIERITDDLYDLCGGDADKFEASPEFETSINKLMAALIGCDGCESRAAAQESALRLKERSRCLTRLIERAEIGLTKLSEAEYKSLREIIIFGDGDK